MAIRFLQDYIPEFLRTASSDTFLTDETALTWCVWVYRSAGTGGYIMVKGDAYDHTAIRLIFNDTSGHIQAVIEESGDYPTWNASWSESTVAVTEETWTHIACTWDGSGDKKLYLYINGSKLSGGDIVFQRATASSVLELDSPLYLASDEQEEWDLNFVGYLEQAAIWNRVLSDEDIAAMVNMRLRPNHPRYLKNLIAYWPLEGRPSGLVKNGYSGVNNNCVAQSGGNLTKDGTLYYKEGPGLNCKPQPIRIGRPDYFPNGCYRIYRDDVHVSRCRDGATEVSIIDPDLSEGQYEYTVTAVSQFGIESSAKQPSIAEIDADGDLVGPVGNAPTSLRATAIAGGKIRLDWIYNSAYEPATPTGFKIYLNVAESWVLQDTEDYSAGKRGYSWTSDALTDGVDYEYIVRTYRTISEVDYEESNEESVTATADATGPPAITSITASLT